MNDSKTYFVDFYATVKVKARNHDEAEEKFFANLDKKFCYVDIDCIEEEDPNLKM